MAVVGTAEIEVRPDTRGFGAAVQKDIEKPLADSAKRIAKTLAGAFVVREGVRFFADTVQQATTLEEATSKVNVVFREGAAEVQDWAVASAEAFGMSESAALEATGTYGNLFQAFGLGREQATEMSTTLVGLAADLASFNNTSMEDAIIAIRSGLSGETEPLKRFGVALSDVRLKTEAMNLGFGEIKGVLDPATKAQAAYSLIMKDTALAQGDFARTSDGLANQQRILAAEFANAKTEIGVGLLPVTKELVGLARDELVPALTEAGTTAGPALGDAMLIAGEAVADLLPDLALLAGDVAPLLAEAFAAAGPAIGATGDIIRVLNPALEVLVDLVGAIPDPVLQIGAVALVANRGLGALQGGILNTSQRLGSLAVTMGSDKLLSGAAGIEKFATGMGKASLALAGVSVAIGAGIAIYDAATAASRRYDAQVKDLTGSLGQVATGQAEVNEVVGEFLDGMVIDKDLAEPMRAFGVTVEDMETAIRRGGDVLDPFRAKVRELGIDLQGVDFGKLDDSGNYQVVNQVAEAFGLSAKELRGFINEIEDYDNVAQDAAKSALDVAVAQGDITAATAAVAEGLAAASGQGENWAWILDTAAEMSGKVVDEQGNLVNATDEGTESVNAQAEAIKANVEALETQANAIRAATDPLFAMIDAENDLREAQQAAKEAADEHGRSSEEYAEANRNAVEAAINLEASERELAAAFVEGGTSREGAVRQLQSLYENGRISKDMLDQLAGQFAVTGAGADGLAESIQNIPVSRHISITASDAEAQTTIRRVRAAIDSLATRIRAALPQVFGGSSRGARWGGVFDYAFAYGGITPAHITDQEIIKYGEPETGGEAFVPRRGNPQRSLSVLETAASWYGHKVVPFARGGIAMASGGVLAAGHGAYADQQRLIDLLFNTKLGAQAFTLNEGDVAATRKALEGLVDTYRQLADVAGDAAAKQLANSGITSDQFTFVADAAVESAKEAAEARQDLIETMNSMFDVRFAVGDVGVDEYLASLQARMDGLIEFSDEWFSYHQRIQRVQQDALDEEWRLNALMVEVGEMTTDEYLGLLQERLDGLERFSDEWASVWREIRSIEDQQAAETQRQAEEAQRAAEQAAAEARRRAEEAARERQRQMEELRRERQRFIDAFAFDMSTAAGDVYLEGENAGEALLLRLEAQVDQATRAAELLETLKARGFDEGLLEGIAAQGVGGLGLLETLNMTDVGRFNALQGQIAGVGGNVANMLVGQDPGPGAQTEREPLLEPIEALVGHTEMGVEAQIGALEAIIVTRDLTGEIHGFNEDQVRLQNDIVEGIGDVVTRLESLIAIGHTQDESIRAVQLAVNKLGPYLANVVAGAVAAAASAAAESAARAAQAAVTQAIRTR